MKKRFSAIALCLALSLGMAACDSTLDSDDELTNPDDMASEDGLSLVSGGVTEYVIVRGDSSAKEVTSAAVTLRKYMEACGVSVKLTTDWEGNGVSDYEIVIGETNRTAEQGNTFDLHSVGENGYYGYVSGTRIYLGGGSDSAVLGAVETFLENFFGYTGEASVASPITELTIPGDYNFTTRESYELEKITVNGNNLDDYRIVVETANLADRDVAKTIQSTLYTACGAWLEIVDRNETWDGLALRLAEDAPTTAGTFEVTVAANGDLLLKTDVARGFLRGFPLFFKEKIEGRSGTVALGANDSFIAPIGLQVLYSEFGAVGDGVTNDIDAIVATHEYANANKIPVKADEGAVYYISHIQKPAVVQTDTDWTGATFVIDDSVIELEERTSNVFLVKGSYDKVDLTIPTPLKREQANLGITLERDSIVVLVDENTKRYIREGLNANDGSDQTDILVVAKDGTIDPNAPLIWDYNQVTSAYAIPMDEETLTLTGGTFKTIANQAPRAYTYFARGIRVQRSNVVVDGLTSFVEGETDTGAPYTGILQVNNCANITVQNCTFTAHKTYKLETNENNSMGSYAINLTSVVNLTFKDCTQTTDILDTAYWGIIGTNFCKNLVMDGCYFSRFDAHQGAANGTVLRSTIGAVNAIGYGTLRIEDSTIYGSTFVGLRNDYGSTWEGELIIKNCTWVPNSGNGAGANSALIGGSYSGFHDFGYECYMPGTITIDGLTVDDEKHNSAYGGIFLLANVTPANTSEAYEQKVADAGMTLYHVPETITISNFKSLSGRKWKLSANPFMYRNVEVIDLDAEIDAEK